MSPTCLRPDCPWRPEPSDQFCLLCGHKLATCEVWPTDGLLFYTGNGWPSKGHRISLKNNGNVATPVRCEAPHHLVLLGKEALGPRGVVSVPAQGEVLLSIRSGNFAPPVSQLTLTGPALGRQPLRIPLYADHEARIELHHDKARLDRAIPFDLYPATDGALQWTLTLLPQQGAVRLTNITGEVKGIGSLELPTLGQRGVLVPSRISWPLTFSWRSHQADKPQPARLTVEAEGLAPTIVELRLFPKAALRLKQRARPALPPAPTIGGAGGDGTVTPLYLGSRTQHVRVDLWNEGFQEVRLTHLSCPTPHVSLHGAQVGALPYPCPSGALPAAVQRAPLSLVAPDPDGSISGGTSLRSLVFAVAPQYQPQRGLLSFELQLTVVPQVQRPQPVEGAANPDEAKMEGRAAPKGQDHVWPVVQETGSPTTVVLNVSLPAERIRAGGPGDLLCIDFGTVNTSAVMIKNGISHRLTFVELYASVGQLPQEALKSVYRVKRWYPPPGLSDLEYGEKAWNSLHADYAQIDYVPKLRLGTDQKRPVRDGQGALEMVSGRDGTATVLHEVLAQVMERVGVKPERVRLTCPVGLDATSEDQLKTAVTMAADRAGLASAGLEVEVVCTEPEAYLWHLCSSTEFRLALARAARQPIDQPAEPARKGGARSTLDRAEEADAGPLLGFVFDLGGGTTDVTLFEYLHKHDRIEMIASHGYRWLGGEMLTAQVATLLHQSVVDCQRYPFPDVKGDHTFRATQLTPENPHAAHNFNEVRKYAETLKMSPANLSIPLSLLDREGNRKTDLAAKVDKKKLEDRLGEILAKAIDDTLERIRAMHAYGLLTAREPRFIALAGNGARLWCLPGVLKARLSEVAGVTNPVIDFNHEHCKRGVVSGLSTWGMLGLIEIQRRQAGRHWWYLQIGTSFELLLPAGAPWGWGQAPEHKKRPLLAGKFVQAGQPFPLASGPGPQPSLNADQAAADGVSSRWKVDTSALRGTRVQVAMGLDERGAPGLFLKAESSSEWRWFPATEVA